MGSQRGSGGMSKGDISAAMAGFAAEAGRPTPKSRGSPSRKKAPKKSMKPETKRGKR